LLTDSTGAALDPVWISQKFERFLIRRAEIRKRILDDGWFMHNRRPTGYGSHEDSAKW